MEGKLVLIDVVEKDLKLDEKFIYWSKLLRCWKITRVKKNKKLPIDTIPKVMCFQYGIMTLPVTQSQWPELIESWPQTIERGAKQEGDLVVARILHRPGTNNTLAIVESSGEAKFHPGEQVIFEKDWFIQVGVTSYRIILEGEVAVITMVSDTKDCYGVQTVKGQFNWIPEDYMKTKPSSLWNKLITGSL